MLLEATFKKLQLENNVEDIENDLVLLSEDQKNLEIPRFSCLRDLVQHLNFEPNGKYSSEKKWSMNSKLIVGPRELQYQVKVNCGRRS